MAAVDDDTVLVDSGVHLSSEDRHHGSSDDDGGFVHVTRPMQTVSKFAEWMSGVQLPDAQAVMQGDVSGDDTIQALVGRRTFMNDILRSFKGSVSAVGGVGADAWPTLWSQFLRDFPRERIVIDGARVRLATAPQSPTSSSAPTPDEVRLDVEQRVLPAIRSFIRSRLPPALADVAYWKERAARQQRAESIASSSAAAATVLSVLNPFAWLAGPSPSKQEAEEAHKTADEGHDDGDAVVLASPPPVPESTDDVVENYTRVVVLMAQQAVLALPLEIVTAQYCSDPSAALYVGEVTKDDPQAHDAGMRVTLSPTPDKEHGATLSVAKLFRVFSLVDSADYTLFYVDVRVELDLLRDGDDHVSLCWRVIPATAPVHNVARIHGQASVAVRRCDCLGASSGYHKAGCPLQVPAGGEAVTGSRGGGLDEEDDEP